MMQQLCAFTERANASAARVVDTASALCGNLSTRFMAIGTTTTPCAPTPSAMNGGLRRCSRNYVKQSKLL
jgi:hypothetical protein